MTGASESGRGKWARAVATSWLACVCATAGCFRDEGPGLLCAGTECAASSGSTGVVNGASSATTEAPTTGTGADATGTGGQTTGAPVDTGLTMRIDSMKFVDPHLFLEDTTDPNMPVCTADITDAVNTALGDDIAAGDFNLLLRFEDLATATEVRVIAGNCEAPSMPGAMWSCTQNDSKPVVLLGLEQVATDSCRDLDPAVYAAENVAQISDPTQPCVRTKRSSFSLAISGSLGALDLREAQFVASIDDVEAPTKLVNGVLYGFLTKLSAENLSFDIPIVGTRTLWSVIDVPGCEPNFPELLPSVDFIDIKGTGAPGVWLAINFTAERVTYEPSAP